MELMKLREVTKTFPGVLALDRVNFDLKKHEIHCLVGHNGAGKSTLVKLLSGIYGYDPKTIEGEIFIKQNIVKISSPIIARGLGIAAVHQGRDLVPDLTGYENMFLGIEELNGFGLLKIKQMVDSAFQMLNNRMGMKTKVSLNIPVKYLSTTEQEIIAIAKALITRCEILLVDEASAALDLRERGVLFEILKELRKEGIGIVYISHYIEELFEIGDRVTVLRDGRVVGVKDIKETDLKEIVHLMVGDVPHVDKSNRNSFSFKDTSGNGEKDILEIRDLKNGGLKEINFNVGKGEIVGITGLAGCGMEELCETIFGLFKHYTGKIFLDGKGVVLKSPISAITKGIGLISNDRREKGLVMVRPISENISYTKMNIHPEMFANYQKFIRSLSKKVIKSLNIKAFSERQKVDTLSGGNQQKVLVGRWFSLVDDLRVIVCIEPTEGVDVKTREEIHELILNLASKGKGIIIASGDLDEILALSSKILIMSDGMISTILKNENLSKKFLLEKILGKEKNRVMA